MTVYLDYNAATPCLAGSAYPFTFEHFSNASGSHFLARESKQAFDDALNGIRDALGLHEHDIVITSGGTEANCLALQSFIDDEDKIACCGFEHPSVRLNARTLIEIPCLSTGQMDVEALSNIIVDNRDIRLVSIMFANNETGIIQPIERIKKVCIENNVLLHCDASQGLGKVPRQLLTFLDHQPDLITLTGQKQYAVAGIGALLVRKGLEPIQSQWLDGGRQQQLRSGTLPVALAQMLSASTKFCIESEELVSKVFDLSQLLFSLLKDRFPSITLNNRKAHSLYNTLSIVLPCCAKDVMLELGSQVCFSTGSSCCGDKLSKSLLLMGLEPEIIRRTARISLGFTTTEDEVRFAAKAIINVVETLQSTTKCDNTE
ncbi:hypothetical protein PCE1_001763 [Barthelona sp. PCE]